MQKETAVPEEIKRIVSKANGGNRLSYKEKLAMHTDIQHALHRSFQWEEDVKKDKGFITRTWARFLHCNSPMQRIRLQKHPAVKAGRCQSCEAIQILFPNEIRMLEPLKGIKLEERRQIPLLTEVA